MTGPTRSSHGLDLRRRKLLFRSWHRGIREMDLVMGRFADAEIGRLTDTELGKLYREARWGEIDPVRRPDFEDPHRAAERAGGRRIERRLDALEAGFAPGERPGLKVVR